MRWWSDTIHKAVMLAHQAGDDDDAPDRLKEVGPPRSAADGMCRSPRCARNVCVCVCVCVCGRVRVPMHVCSCVHTCAHACRDHSPCAVHHPPPATRQPHLLCIPLTQQRIPPTHPPTQILQQLGSYTIGLCLTKPWFFELFNFDFSSGCHREAPEAVWQRTASSLRLSPRQARGQGLMS